IPFNVGIRAAKGEKVILQNPECLHFGNILEYTEANLTVNNYLSFGCFSLDKESTENLHHLLKIPSKIPEILNNNNAVVTKDGELGWYNHSVFRPKAYHFCTAISRKALKKLNGFDERFALGIAYDDNEFIERVKKNLKISFVDDEIILQQNHYSPTSTSFQNRKNKDRLYEINQDVFKNRIKRFNYNFILQFIPNRFKKSIIRFINKCEKKLRNL